MKRFACILIFTLGVARVEQVPAAEKSETRPAPSKTIKFAPRLTKGDRFVLELTAGSARNGRPEMAGIKVLQVIDVEIMGDKKNILFGWTVRNTGGIGPDAKPATLPPQVAGLMSACDGVKMIFELSPDYKRIGLKNFKQIKALMSKAIEKTLADMDKSPQAKATLWKVMSTMLASREAIEQFCQRGISLLLTLAGLELEREGGSATESDWELPMPFGGGALPGKRMARVVFLEQTAGQAMVSSNSKMDHKKAAKAFLATMKVLAKKLNQPAPTEKDIPNIDMWEVSSFVVDLKTNLPRSAARKLTLMMGKNKQTQTLTLVLKKNQEPKK
ncbi:MAG: hypothetical protein QGG42_05945 [Phycisphaerae bacterium]|jgi:hypothetical protein|nr:hypothetical protein [Phycisphaerae bacterium]